jgi:hypothetical protein
MPKYIQLSHLNMRSIRSNVYNMTTHSWRIFSIGPRSHKISRIFLALSAYRKPNSTL